MTKKKTLANKRRSIIESEMTREQVSLFKIHLPFTLKNYYIQGWSTGSKNLNRFGLYAFFEQTVRFVFNSIQFPYLVRFVFIFFLTGSVPDRTEWGKYQYFRAISINRFGQEPNRIGKIEYKQNCLFVKCTQTEPVQSIKPDSNQF